MEAEPCPGTSTCRACGRPGSSSSLARPPCLSVSAAELELPQPCVLLFSRGAAAQWRLCAPMCPTRPWFMADPNLAIAPA